MTAKISVEEAGSHILYALKQAEGSKSGTASTIVNENAWPWTTGMTLTVCHTTRIINIGGILPARVAQSKAELSALLTGETPKEMPKYNIDWDTRSTNSGDIVAVGSLDFNTVKEGALKLAKQINGEVPDYAWMTDEENKKITEDITREFEAEHQFCLNKCEFGDGCPVKWPGGQHLRGCRKNNPDDPIHQTGKD